MTAVATCDFQISGTLIEHASMRLLPIADGHVVPMLCLVMQADTAIGTIVRVHQPFPAGHESACEARARQLRKGTAVQVVAPSVGIELCVASATHVHVAQPASAPAAPATPETQPA